MVRDLLSIVDYRTYLRWVRTDGLPQRHGNRRMGRPTIARAVMEIVTRIGRESTLGYGMILGELRRLGYRAACQRTVGYILRRNGIPPAPDRHDNTWARFLPLNAPTLLVTDFLTKRTFSLRGGLRTFYTLFFLHVGTRRILHLASTEHPDAAWVSQQARNLCMAFDTLPRCPRRLLRDRDTKFTVGFDRLLESEGIRVVRLPRRSPNLNAYAESWVATVKRELLDHFFLPSPTRLQWLLCEYVAYYNSTRPHRGLAYRAPMHDPRARDPTQVEPPDVVSRTWCAGLIRSYHRRVG